MIAVNKSVPPAFEQSENVGAQCNLGAKLHAQSHHPLSPHSGHTTPAPSPFLSYPHPTHRPRSLHLARLHLRTPPLTTHIAPPHTIAFTINIHHAHISGTRGIAAPKNVFVPSATPSRHRDVGTTAYTPSHPSRDHTSHAIDFNGSPTSHRCTREGTDRARPPSVAGYSVTHHRHVIHAASA